MGGYEANIKQDQLCTLEGGYKYLFNVLFHDIIEVND